MPEFDFYETEDKLEELIRRFYELREDVKTANDMLGDLNCDLDDLRLLAEDIAGDFTMMEGVLDNPETGFDVEE